MHELMEILKLFPDIPMSTINSDGTLPPLRTQLAAFSYKPPPDPPELKAAIAAATLKAMKTPERITWALSTIATDQWCRADKGRQVHTCFDALMAGDDAQFGVLLAREIRREVIETAAGDARDEWAESQP